MLINSLPDKIKYLTVLFLLANLSFLFAEVQNPKTNTKKEASSLSRQEEKNLTELQKQARDYRSQGLALQEAGNLEKAMSFYQKAIQLDPLYAVAYNDLGVVYEAKGSLSEAEENYLKAIQVDPYFLSAYSNLALLYESRRELDKAEIYWAKRAKLGLADDPWTQKAKQRLADIRMVRPGTPDELREEQVVSLTKELLNKKQIIKGNDRNFALEHLHKAKLKYKKGDELGALKEAIDAKSLDPANTDIDTFIDKVQRRLLTK